MTAQKASTMRIPVLSDIGAAKSFNDAPIEKWREIRPPGTRARDQLCGAEISGNSLVDDGILDGDLAVFRTNFESHELKPGRLVAALTPYGLLIKHIYVGLAGNVRLVSANTGYEDIVLDSGEVTVQGIVVRIERDI
jgi:SOS-response transcriptional repressor LexA